MEKEYEIQIEIENKCYLGSTQKVIRFRRPLFHSS